MADFYNQLDQEAGIINYDLLDQEAGVPAVESSFASQALGAVITGGMNFVRSVILEAPTHVAKLAVMLGTAGEGLPPEAIEAHRKMVEEKQKIDPSYEPPGVGHLRLIKEYKQGMESIIRSHPEWEYESHKNFLDLLTSPRKLFLAIAESTPVLVSAGLMIAAGQPHIASAMMYASEGQEAYDRAIIDKATLKEAEWAYHMYGSVATIVETLRLKGMLKIATLGKSSPTNTRNQTHHTT
ncbi:unnamed protein product, partial [marine sediment metagenome]